MATKTRVTKPVELPPKRSSGYDWDQIAREVRGDDGAWCQVFENDTAARAEMIRAGSVAALKPEHGFEVRTRNNHTEESTDGRKVKMCSLYLRYNRHRDTRED